MLRCKHCDSETVMPKSGFCLSCGEFNTVEINLKQDEPIDIVDEISAIASNGGEETGGINTIENQDESEHLDNQEGLEEIDGLYDEHGVGIEAEIENQDEQDESECLDNQEGLEEIDGFYDEHGVGIEAEVENQDEQDESERLDNQEGLEEIDGLCDGHGFGIEAEVENQDELEALDNQDGFEEPDGLYDQYDDGIETETIEDIEDQEAFEASAAFAELDGSSVLETLNEVNVGISDDGYELPPAPPIKTRKVVFPENVENRAQLSNDYKKIVNSCQHSLEKLKGELITGAQKKYTTFMLTSANRQEGVTVGALTIAIGLSRFGNSKVLLIDANAINPQLQNLFSINYCNGFTEYITDKLLPQSETPNVAIGSSVYQALSDEQKLDGLSWAKCSYYTEYDGLFVMPYSKDEPVSLWELVEDKTFQQRLDALKGVFDYIVLDGASIMSSSESAVLSQYVDGVVLVIKAEQTKWEIAELAVNTVRKAGGVFVGSILNRRKFYIPKFLYGWI